MKNLFLLILLVALGPGAFIAYIGSQQPSVWLDRQWAGLSLSRGGYRSWTLQFCDGFMRNDAGKWEPVVLGRDGEPMRRGYFRWPRFHHLDIRGLTFTNSVLLGTNFSHERSDQH